MAAEAAGNYISGLNLDNLSHEDKLLAVHSGLLALKQEINGFPCPEYIHLANYKNAVEKLFYSRLLFFNRNESAEVKNALILHHKLVALQRQYVKNKIWIIKHQIFGSLYALFHNSNDP